MSGIVKSEALDKLSIRSLQSHLIPERPSLEAVEIARLRHEVGQLKENIAAGNETIKALRVEVEESRRQGYSCGHTDGEAKAVDRQRERLTLLSEGIAGTQSEVREVLAQTERLAAALARDCLEIMMTDPAERARLVCDLIRHQVARIERESILRVDVARSDFASSDALEALASNVGVPSIMLTPRADLAPGDCRMTLQLGGLEIGIEQQWETLRNALTEISMPAEHA